VARLNNPAARADNRTAIGNRSSSTDTAGWLCRWISVLSSVALVLASFALLIAYTQRVAVTIQAGNVIADVVQDLERAIAEARPNRVVATGSVPTPAPPESLDVAAVAARCQAEGVPVPVLTTASYERFASRGEADYQDKLLSAMRFQFGGHLEKPGEKQAA
jgi:6-phosphogluconate dehydrogenase